MTPPFEPDPSADSNSPPSTSTPTGPAPSSLPVHVSDLLLILILSLGSSRLLSLFILGALPHEAGGAALLLAVASLLFIQAALILGLVYLLVIRKYRLSWADLGLRPVPRAWYYRAAGLAVVLLPLVAMINALLIPALTKEPFQNPQINAIAPAGFSWAGLIVMAIMAGIVAPFAEEIAFRGLLFGWLRERLGLHLAALISALCFASLHGLLLLIPALTVIGYALAILYHRSGSLWTAIVAHGIFNTIMVSILYAALANGLELP